MAPRIKSKYARNRKGRKPGLDDPFETFEVHVPTKLATALRESTREKETSVERLMTRVLLNSFRLDYPSDEHIFQLDCELPKQFTYQSDVADKVLLFLLKCDAGVDYETLCIMSYDFGAFPTMVMQSVRKLVDTGEVELVAVRNATYPIVRLKRNRAPLRTERFKTIAGEPAKLNRHEGKGRL